MVCGEMRGVTILAGNPTAALLGLVREECDVYDTHEVNHTLL